MAEQQGGLPAQVSKWQLEVALAGIALAALQLPNPGLSQAVSNAPGHGHIQAANGQGQDLDQTEILQDLGLVMRLEGAFLGLQLADSLKARQLGRRGGPRQSTSTFFPQALEIGAWAWDMPRGSLKGATQASLLWVAFGSTVLGKDCLGRLGGPRRLETSPAWTATNP